jgi:Secretion system C-terminal sorting domain
MVVLHSFRFLFPLILLFFFQSSLSSQNTNINNKNDYVWVLGYNSQIPHPEWGRTDIDFNFSPPKITKKETHQFSMGELNSSICQLHGSLLLYSSGCNISSYKGSPLLNSDLGTPKERELCVSLGDNPIANGGILLPVFSNNNSSHAFFYEKINSLKSTKFPLSPLAVSRLLSATIIEKNDSLIVTEKDNEIIVDTLYGGQLRAVRHANGNDWWIICPEFASNKYYSILLGGTTPKVTSQRIGMPTSYLSDGSGQAVFSPDGSKYVRMTAKEGVMLFDFDRCSGQLSNFKKFNLVLWDSIVGGAVAFSPNGRYLYVHTLISLYQYDMYEKDIEASKMLIDDYNFNGENYYTAFYLMQLAPDNKIYVGTTGATKFLHIINSPNNRGKLCDFKQHAIELPTYMARGLPNHPNFRLGALKGSPCDTIKTTPVQETSLGEQHIFKLFPNPTTDVLQITTDYTKTSELQLFNSIGQLVKVVSIAPRIEVGGLPTGIYIYRILGKEGWLQSGKLVIQRE